MADEQAAPSQQKPQQQFAMQRIYTRDISFESPAVPGVFREQQWTPQVSVDLNTRSEQIDDQGNFEVVLAVTVTAKLGEKVVFLCEVQQAGIFIARGIEEEALRRLLGAAAPNILFPYAREAVDNLCIRGGFPAVMLAPVNFDALYQQARVQADGVRSGQAASH